MIETLSGTDLVLERGGRVVLLGVSFEAVAGQALVLTGPNGAGKTTLIRACAGLLPVSSGQISLVGGNGELTIAEQCHYVGHLNALKTSMSVRENLLFWAAFLKIGSTETRLEDTGQTDKGSVRALVDGALEWFRLRDLADVPSGYLSAGQKRRAALARLLVARRPVWLLDEPTVALDAQMRDLFVDVVDEHLLSGGIVLAATHLPLPFRTKRELRLRLRADGAGSGPCISGAAS